MKKGPFLVICFLYLFQKKETLKEREDTSGFWFEFILSFDYNCNDLRVFEIGLMEIPAKRKSRSKLVEIISHQEVTKQRKDKLSRVELSQISWRRSNSSIFWVSNASWGFGCMADGFVFFFLKKKEWVEDAGRMGLLELNWFYRKENGEAPMFQLKWDIPV